MKLFRTLLALLGLWIVLNIGLYAFVFPHPPRLDATCKTLQDGRLVSSRPCSRAEYQYKRILYAEGVLFGLTALGTYLVNRRKEPDQFIQGEATLGLVLGLVAIPALLLVGGGAVLAVFAILCSADALRRIKGQDLPGGGRGVKVRAVLGIVFSGIALLLLAAYLIAIIPHHGLGQIILVLRSIPLPR